MDSVTQSQRRILVVEDDQPIRTLIDDILEDEGYTTLHAMDVASALEVAEREEPDAILLDLGLPPTSGLDVLEQLRANPATRHTPVVIVSGSAAPVGGEASECDYLRKPFDVADLLEHVERAVALADAERAVPAR